jgi:hypothetical protein
MRAKPKFVSVAGVRVGIVTLATSHDLERGNVQHALSYAFPVAYAVAEGVSVPALMCGDEAALAPIVAAVQRLEALGVDVIVGACGSFAHYQRDVAQVARVPVCMSILAYVPFLLQMLPRTRSLGIIFARESAFTARAREQCGILDCDRIVTLGADSLQSFQPILDSAMRLDHKALQTDLTDLVLRTQQAHPEIGAWMLQCSDLPPFARSVSLATGLPVFDMSLLIEHFHMACNRQSFE